MRSIIPAVPLEIDLGEGQKVYKLVRTNFSSVALMGIMGSPELAAANAALAQAQERTPDTGEDDLGSAFTSLRLDHQCRLIAAQLFGLLQYDHPEIEYRDVLASIPPEPAVIAKIGKACMEAWSRGEPPKAPKVLDEDEEDNEDETPDPTQGRRGGKEKREPKASASSNSESGSTTTTD